MKDEKFSKKHWGVVNTPYVPNKEIEVRSIPFGGKIDFPESIGKGVLNVGMNPVPAPTQMQQDQNELIDHKAFLQLYDKRFDFLHKLTLKGCSCIDCRTCLVGPCKGPSSCSLKSTFYREEGKEVEDSSIDFDPETVAEAEHTEYITEFQPFIKKWAQKEIQAILIQYRNLLTRYPKITSLIHSIQLPNHQSSYHSIPIFSAPLTQTGLDKLERLMKNGCTGDNCHHGCILKGTDSSRCAALEHLGEMDKGITFTDLQFMVKLFAQYQFSKAQITPEYCEEVKNQLEEQYLRRSDIEMAQYKDREEKLKHLAEHSCKGGEFPCNECPAGGGIRCKAAAANLLSVSPELRIPLWARIEFLKMKYQTAPYIGRIANMITKGCDLNCATCLAKEDRSPCPILHSPSTYRQYISSKWARSWVISRYMHLLKQVSEEVSMVTEVEKDEDARLKRDEDARRGEPGETYLDDKLIAQVVSPIVELGIFPSISNLPVTSEYPPSVSESFKAIVTALRESSGYYQGWKANIAMAFIDEMRENVPDNLLSYDKLHKIANNAAETFLKRLMQ